MSLLTVHVTLSLFAILAGFVVAGAMVRSDRSAGTTSFFLLTTTLTCITGFFFRPFKLGPPNLIGILSLVVLAVAVVALHGRKLAGPWRVVYVVTALLALYLNSFVAIVQAFQKLPALNALAPKGNEPAFAAAQLFVLAIFVVIGVYAVRRFHPAKAST